MILPTSAAPSAHRVLPLLALVLSAASTPAQDGAKAPEASGAEKQRAWTKSQQRGFDFLSTQQEDGRFFLSMPGRGGRPGRKIFDAGLTGLALAALQSKPAKLRSEQERELIDKSLAWLVEQQAESGAFGRRTLVYSTSSVVFALTKSKKPSYDEAIAKARKLLRSLQNLESRGYKATQIDYGAFGYGNNERADLSNTQFAIQAMREAGVEAQDEAFAKALVFLERVQNLRKVNSFRKKTEKDGKTIEIVSGDDGGATYYPGASAAGHAALADGRYYPRSYGSMTYALLKTYTLCGIRAEDPRVQAALGWLRRHWTVEINPGADPELGESAQYQGLYYYYMVMAQSLDLLGIKELALENDGDAGSSGAAGDGEVDSKDDGAEKVERVDWRAALRSKLLSLQNENGSWRNTKNGRWYEGLDAVCSAYALLALEHCSAAR